MSMQNSNGKECLHGKEKVADKQIVYGSEEKNRKEDIIWNVALYAAETWTLTETLRKKSEAFESWVWRRTLKYSWNKKSQMNKFGKEFVKKYPS